MIFTLDDGDSRVFPMGDDYLRLSIIPSTGATVTVSKVDSNSASAHDADTSTDYTEATVLDVEWPFYRVSVAGASARVAVL